VIVSAKRAGSYEERTCLRSFEGASTRRSAMPGVACERCSGTARVVVYVYPRAKFRRGSVPRDPPRAGASAMGLRFTCVAGWGGRGNTRSRCWMRTPRRKIRVGFKDSGIHRLATWWTDLWSSRSLAQKTRLGTLVVMLWRRWCCRVVVVTEGASQQDRGLGRMSQRTAAWVAWCVCRKPSARGFRSGAHLFRLVDSAAQRVDSVARPGRLLGGCPRRTSPRRPHRLAAPGEPLRMVVARIRLELNPHRGIGILRGLLPIGGAGIVTLSAGGKRDAGGVGMGGGDNAVALPVAAVPHGAPAIAALASPSVDRFGGGSDGRYPRLILG
jgi:hypothetical protein